MAKTASKSFSLTNSSQKSSFFAVLMYALCGHHRYFKFKGKYQQYGPCFQTIFPFLMAMIQISNRKSAQKVNEKGTKSSFILQILMSIETRFCCFISLLFDYQWKIRIFSSLASFLKIFTFLFYSLKAS